MKAAISSAVLLAAVVAPSLVAQGGDSLAAPPARATPDPRNWVGERLEYDAAWGFVRLGRAELIVAGIDTVRGDSALHLRFVIDGGNVMYRINNQWDSWVGLEDFTSRRFVQDHEEGNKRYRNVYEIFPDSGYYRQEGVDSILPTSAEPLDDAAFFYFVRLVDLEVGGTYPFDRYFKPDRNPVTLRVVARETVDVPAGRFDCLVVQPIIKGNGIFREKAEGRMWITNDERRMVVQIKSKFYFGSLTFRLTKLTEGTPRREAP
jgi:hypothetical protein